jgi:hypothetical protein
MRWVETARTTRKAFKCDVRHRRIKKENDEEHIAKRLLEDVLRALLLLVALQVEQEGFAVIVLSLHRVVSLSRRVSP